MGVPAGGPHAVHSPRPPAEGPAAGSASRIIAALMPAAGRGEGRGGGPQGREGCVRPPAPSLRASVPLPHAAGGARTGACRSSTFLDQAAKPGAGGSPALVVMSVALSNRFQGRRHCPPRGRAPLPRPRPADRPPAPIPSAWCPLPATCARRAHGCAGGKLARARAQGRVAGQTPASRAASLSPPGGKAFGLLKARQERRLAEINRVSACRRLRLSSRAAGAAREAPPKPPTPRGLHLPREAVPAAKSTPFLFIPRAPRNVLPQPLPLCPGPQVGLPPPAPRSSAPGISGCKLLLSGWRTRARPGAPMPAGPGLPGSPPGTSHRDLVLEGTPDVSEQSRFYSLGTEGRPREAWWLP